MKVFLGVVVTLLISFGSVKGQSDTLYHFTCGGSIPSGWQTYDSTNNNFNWIHTYTGIEAVYNPASFTNFNSTSSSDGWLLFHAAFYNTDTTGGVMNQISPEVMMNSTLTSSPMNCSGEPIVFLSFEHDYHTLSSPLWGSMDVDVSNDGINWSSFPVNTGPDQPLNQLVSLDISSIAAMQSQVWIRFHFRNLAWHFWVIDDILLTKSSIVSTSQLADNKEVIQLHPNPCTGGTPLTISGLSTDEDYSIFSVDGKMMFSGKLLHTDPKIDISNLSAGTYFVSVQGKMNKIVVLH